MISGIVNGLSSFKQQKEQIERQQKEIDALKAIICSQNESAELCQP